MGGELVVGNRRGLNLAGLPGRIRVLESKVGSLEKEVGSLEKEVGSLEKDKVAEDLRIASLEDRVSSLASSLDAYKLQRNRFISTFKRDKLGITNVADRRIIGAGNALAHGGDAVVDAQLYEGTGGRRDVTAFEKLYGIPAGYIRIISHQPTIDVLNTHAGVIASKHKVGSDKFYKLFAEFVKLFKESGEGFEEGYLDGRPTDVTLAYWAFLNCIKEEVIRVDAVEASD